MLALLVKENDLWAENRLIQRHKIKRCRGLSNGTLNLFFSQSKRLLVFGLSLCNFSLLNLRTDI